MKLKFFLPLLLILIAFSCGRKNRFSIDSDYKRVEVKIQRFDSDLIQLDTTDLSVSVEQLYARYPRFLPTFISDLDTISSQDTLAVARVLKDFITYPKVMQINQKVLETFSDVSAMEKDISEAYTYISYYFPKLKLPEVYFYVSGLSRPVMMDEGMNFIGIGSDFYLGSDYELYQSAVYDYQLQNMRPESISTDVVSAVLFNYFRFDSKQNRLIDNMLHRGKVMYLLSVFMPEQTKQDIMGYTDVQWSWAVNNESKIWKQMISQKDLFSSDLPLIRSYLNEAPFTSRISPESPGRLGTWVGMRIVENYMKKNKDVTLQRLMQLNDYQKLLQESGYK